MVVDSETENLFLVQVTVVAGPPEEMQVRVLDAMSYVSGEVMGRPVMIDHSCCLIKGYRDDLPCPLL